MVLTALIGQVRSGNTLFRWRYAASTEKAVIKPHASPPVPPPPAENSRKRIARICWRRARGGLKNGIDPVWHLARQTPAEAGGMDNLRVVCHADASALEWRSSLTAGLGRAQHDSLPMAAASNALLIVAVPALACAAWAMLMRLTLMRWLVSVAETGGNASPLHVSAKGQQMLRLDRTRLHPFSGANRRARAQEEVQLSCTHHQAAIGQEGVLYGADPVVSAPLIGSAYAFS
jgi:hypothetical protein